MPISSRRPRASAVDDTAHPSALVESVGLPAQSGGPVSIGRVWVEVLARDDRGFRYRYPGIEVSREAFERALSELGTPAAGADAGGGNP